MKAGDLVYVDYVVGGKYFLIKNFIFSKATGETRYILIDPKTGKTDYLWGFQIELVCVS